MRVARPALVAFALLASGLAGGPALAGDPPKPAKDGSPAAAAARVRAGLPVPVEGAGFEFEGDLSIAGDWAGTVRYSVDVGAYREQPVWLVREETAQDWGGLQAKTSLSLYLAKDLSLLRGELTSQSAEGQDVHFTFIRKGDAFEVVRSVTVAGGEAQSTPSSVPAPADATFGRAALLLFLRHAPKEAATYSLPLFAPERALAAAGSSEDDPATDAEPVLVEVRGAAKYRGASSPVRDSWMAAVRQAGRSFELHLDPKRRALIGVVGLMPPTHVVPKGAAGEKRVTDDEKPATTWKAAFLKFGHGYHMAKPAILEAAFHWATMYEHEVGAGSWQKEQGIEEFKKAWMNAFLTESLHRSQADTDQLLLGTLATGTATEKDADTVVFAAAAQFGGGIQRTYHLKRIEGVWYIVRIDGP